jgi:hypothetical protein
MHIVIVKYTKALDIVDQHIFEHRAWLDIAHGKGHYHALKIQSFAKPR